MLTILATLLVAHFVADFLLQSHDMSQRKSVEFKVLFMHCGIQAGVVSIFSLFLFPWEQALWIGGFNAVLHALVDWNIWRAYKRYVKAKRPENWEWWLDTWFYKTVGFDQLLHGLSLILSVHISTILFV